MDWRRIAKAILYPRPAIMVFLLPFSSLFLAYSMMRLGPDSIASFISYALSFYTLTVWVLRIPYAFDRIRAFKDGNRYARRYIGDVRLRASLSLGGSLLWNTVYAVLQLSLGLYHHSAWYCSLGAYYALLAIMRMSLIRYLRSNKPGENMASELRKYGFCGFAFIVMTSALAAIAFFMVYRNRTYSHNTITDIAMAAYAFTIFVLAVVNIVKYRRYNSPILSASKAVSMVSACVSMLTLESMMLSVFDDGSLSALDKRIMLGATGAAVYVFVMALAITMIVRSSRRLKALDAQKETG